MARAPKPKRPKNREIENEMIRPPEQEGEPPRPKKSRTDRVA